MRLTLFFSILFFFSHPVLSAPLNVEVVDLIPGQVLPVTQVSESADVLIDGKLTESVWNELPVYDEFVIVMPDTLERGVYATHVRLFYTTRGFYVGYELEQPRDTLLERLSGRDLRRINRDSVHVTLDTSGQGRYGYTFGIGLGDSLMDGTVLPERQFSSDWDGPWHGRSSETESGWSAEFFIPWSTVAMPAGGETRLMGLYLSRKVAHLDERWGWPALPNSKPRFMSGLQKIELREVTPGQQYNIYPFSAITVDEIDDETRYKVGADFFWRPSSNFQLNATVNPDFGSVESDDVVINLTATETFFPEKRLFFQEGQEIFVASPRADTRGGGVGMRGPPTTLVNTRRIGGKPRSPDLAPGVTVSDRELIRPVDLYGAAKFTGQIGRFRYGLLGAFEQSVKFNAMQNGNEINLIEEGSDYGVARLLYEDNEGGAYRAVGVLSTAVLNPQEDAKTHGVDWHYLTPTGKLKVDGQAFMSDVDNVDRGYGGFVDFEYNIRQGVNQRLGIEYLDEHVDIHHLGFLSRNDRISVRSAHTRIQSNLGWARDNQFDVRGFVSQNGDGLFNGGGIMFAEKLTFNSLSSINGRVGFNAGHYDDINSLGNGVFRVEEKISFSLGYSSDTSQSFSYDLELGFDEEDLGGASYTAGLALAWRPTGRFNLSLKVNYQDRDGWLLHQEDANFTTFEAEQWQPQVSVEYFVSARQQFRVSLQWVGVKAREDEFFLVPTHPGDLIEIGKPPGPADDFAISEMVIQARYRWELAPLSDLFVVYTRAADVTRSLDDANFQRLFRDAFDEPIGNQLVVKLRYRFGS
ncbi:MAG: DUF5916 domain-containing protein [Gammaproteobacteria bacterium]|nr:DUF5916 domain-containing protein [Gammaproteobacteria bacterium]